MINVSGLTKSLQVMQKNYEVLLGIVYILRLIIRWFETYSFYEFVIMLFRFCSESVYIVWNFEG